MPGRITNTEDCFWLLGSLCSLYRIPFDAALVASQFPPPYTLATFHEAARALGFKTGSRPLPSDGWAKLPYPCIAFLKHQARNVTRHTEATPGDHQVIPFRLHPEKLPPQAGSFSPSPSHTASHGLQPVADRSSLEGEGEGRGEAETLTPILIVKSDDKKLLYFRPHSQTPETLNLADAPDLLKPDLILIAREQAGADGQPEDIAGFETEKPKFGFRWFIPEALKHKKIWRDVILASLAIQLVGLATPVFTQVIIDKVVVHQTQSTLIVIGVALLMFMLFTMAMTWLRQYLVLHTGNRIDAVLGSQVFRHPRRRRRQRPALWKHQDGRRHRHRQR